MDPLSLDDEQMPISDATIGLIKTEVQNDENFTEINIEFIDTTIADENLINSVNSDDENDSTEIEITDFDPVKSEQAELHEISSNDENSRSIDNFENESISFQDESQDVADSIENSEEEDEDYSFEKFLENFCVFNDADSIENEIHSNTRLNAAKQKLVNNEIGECDDSIIEEERFKCDICMKEFDDGYRLKKHKSRHELIKPYKCQFCPKSFSDKSNRKTHERIHTGERPYECNICQMNFSNQSSCIRHKKRCKIRKQNENLCSSSVGQQIFKCTMCLEVFIEKHDLDRHMLRKHGQPKSFQCEVCNKAFDRIAHLQRHQKTHTGERPYKCKYCSMAFAHSGYRTKHERTHTGEKPFKCLRCPYRSGDKSSVNRHMKRKSCFIVNSNQKHSIQHDATEMNKEFAANVEIDDGERNCLDLQIVNCPEEKSISDQMQATEETLNFEFESVQVKIDPLLTSLETPKLEMIENQRGSNLPDMQETLGDLKDATLQCAYCDRTFDVASELEDHFKEHIDEKLSKIFQNTESAPEECENATESIDNEMTEIDEYASSEGSSSIGNEHQLKDNDFITEINVHQIENERVFECEYCRKQFNFDEIYQQHLRTHTSAAPYSCGFCEKTFTYQWNRNSHELIHSDAMLFECEFCLKRFKSNSSRIRHKKTCSNRTIEQAETAEKPNEPVLENQNEKITQSSLESDTFIHKCTDCGKCFKKIDYLRRHLRTHTDVKPYSCRICGNSFREWSGRKSHELTHFDGMPFECKFCGKKFRAQSSCCRHRKRCEKRTQNDTEMAISNGTNSCFETDKRESMQFIARKIISNEQQQKSNKIENNPSLVFNSTVNFQAAQSFKCIHCTTVFYTNSDLQQHLQIHRVERPYSCQFCEKTFIDAGNQKSHELTHSDATPFECEICLKQFKTNSSRTRHMKVCSNRTQCSNEHICQVCSKVFTKKSHLIYHERIHNGDKPYECNICSKKFTSKPNLNAHCASHSNEKLFKCGKCDKTYKTHSSCCRHRVMEHGRS